MTHGSLNIVTWSFVGHGDLFIGTSPLGLALQIEVTVPGLLKDCVGGVQRFKIEARTLAEALRLLRQQYPLLRVHVWDDHDQIRQHVLVYYNEESVKWVGDHERVELSKGDRIAIIQAVSGG